MGTRVHRYKGTQVTYISQNYIIILLSFQVFPDTQVHRYTFHNNLIHFSQPYNYSTFFSTWERFTGTQVHGYTGHKHFSQRYNYSIFLYTGHIHFSQWYNYSTFFSTCQRFKGTRVHRSHNIFYTNVTLEDIYTCKILFSLEINISFVH